MFSCNFAVFWFAYVCSLYNLSLIDDIHMDYLILSWWYMMPDPEPTTELQFHLKHPSLNWEGNLYDNFK